MSGIGRCMAKRSAVAVAVTAAATSTTNGRRSGTMLTLANLPPIVAQPPVVDAIQMSGMAVVVPD